MSLIEKPLVACATRRSELASRVRRLSHQLDQDFFAGGEIEQVILSAEDRPAACIVVDHLLGLDRSDVVLRCAKPIMVAVPDGNLQVAFLAGRYGALDIFSDSDDDEEVAICLQAAIESVEDSSKLESFTDPVYQDVTDREKEILRCLLAGESNKRVASLLDIGLRTVEAGRANLMKTLCVNSFAELMIFVSGIENQKTAGFRRAYESIKSKTAATRP